MFWQTLPSKFTLGVMAAACSLTYLVTLLSSSLCNLRHHYANPCCLPVFHVHITCVLSLVSTPPNHAFSFNFLQDNNTLESLNLCDNNIGDKGAAALAKALEVLYTCFFVANSAFKMHAWRHGCCIFPHLSRNSAVQQP